MVSSVIWVVIYAKPPNAGLYPIFQERSRVGADMMYPRHFAQARALAQRDRVVVHFGGPAGSNPYAQHLVLAGCVRNVARSLHQQDAQMFPNLFFLAAQGFPFFPQSPSALTGEEGIIFYELYDPPPSVRPLPRPYPPPKRGDNFKPKLVPDDFIYQVVDAWWHSIVPKGCCAVTKSTQKVGFDLAVVSS